MIFMTQDNGTENAAASPMLQRVAAILLQPFSKYPSTGMCKIFFALSLLIIVSSVNGQIAAPANPERTDTSAVIDFSALKIAELAGPNSGTYNYAGEGKGENEIYNLQPTPKYFEWKNPTSGGAVHINKKDEIEVYQFSLGMIYMYGNDTGDFYMPAPKDTFIVAKNSKDLRRHVGGIGYGNPASVLITSEISLTNSEAIKKILEELWAPGVRIYFITKK